MNTGICDNLSILKSEHLSMKFCTICSDWQLLFIISGWEGPVIPSKVEMPRIILESFHMQGICSITELELLPYIFGLQPPGKPQEQSPPPPKKNTPLSECCREGMNTLPGCSILLLNFIIIALPGQLCNLLLLLCPKNHLQQH